eukprot:SAG22_NODE_2344_length_2686_cov_1.543873_1_plen_122_part_10
MVLFGDTLKLTVANMPKGWEANYVDYDGLKTQIAKIKELRKAGGSDTEAIGAASSAFQTDITAQLQKADAFLAENTKKAEALYNKLKENEDIVLDPAQWAAIVAPDGGSKTLDSAIRQLDEE